MVNSKTNHPYSGLTGEVISEFISTMVLILFGDGCVATFALFSNIGANGGPSPFANTWPVITFGWGFAVMLGIYVGGSVSGAHMNPAVTIANAAVGQFPWKKVIPYVAAQVLGAFVGAALVYFVYHGALMNIVGTKDFAASAGGIFYTAPKSFVGTFGAFGDEFIGTALLVGLIMAITDGRNQPVQANLNPLIIGFLIVAIGTSFGLNTGYAINPARDFGPRLWVALVTSGASFSANNYYFWIPILAPIAGGIVGAFIYKFTMGRIIEVRSVEASA